MKLAIVDAKGNIIVAWDNPRDGRTAIAERAAANVKLALGRYVNRRARLEQELPQLLAAAVDDAILALQAETARL